MKNDTTQKFNTSKGEFDLYFQIDELNDELHVLKNDVIEHVLNIIASNVFINDFDSCYTCYERSNDYNVYHTFRVHTDDVSLNELKRIERQLNNIREFELIDVMLLIETDNVITLQITLKS